MSVFRTLAAALAIHLFAVAPAFSAGTRAVLLSEKNGLFVSNDNGNSWHRFNDGLPGEFVPLSITVDAADGLYLLTRHSGIFGRPMGASAWRSLNSDRFRLRSELHPDRYRKITAFAADDARAGSLALATKHALYRSYDNGRSWASVPMKVLEHNHYITALAFGPSGVLYAGTSFHGIYRVTDRGLVSSSSGLPREPYSADAFFYEEVGAIAADGTNPDVLYAGLNFGGGLYASRDGGRSWRSLGAVPGDTGSLVLGGLLKKGNSLFVSMGGAAWRLNTETGVWRELKVDGIMRRLPSGAKPLALLALDGTGAYPPLFYRIGTPGSPRANDLRARAADKKALYASIPAVRRNLAGLISTIHACKMNAMVIDMKDDQGSLHFPTNNETALRSGAARKPVDVRAILGTLRREGVHSIARVVVFKDPNLFRYDGNRYAIWNARTNAPWRGSEGEYWVDPHSTLAQEYNIALSRELAALGFDEIQFDYIRFPSDGPTHLCRYRHRRFEDGFKSEAIGDFLERAKRVIPVPLSVDIYGFNAMYRFGNWIGQDLEEIAAVVDVVCPMVYPSHFGGRYYRRFPGDEHPYRIVLDSGVRARVISGDGAPLRPYLQAFKMLSPTWGTGYIQSQVRGVLESGVGGYTFWNAKGEYDMVRRALGGRPPEGK
ncbi:MAG TPA: putative glycoside hydrolase [Spirochaetota bacterium]|nr:putative glycoside hydrolase [Spirochaetota bacterium]